MAVARQYKFFIDGREVYPQMDNVCFSRKKEKGQIFCRTEFDGELCFVNDFSQRNYDFDIEDFTYLYDIDQTPERCNDLEILIQECCPDSESFVDCWEGYVCFDTIKFDCDRCTAVFKPEVKDVYTCLLQKQENEFNILEFEKTTICPIIGEYEYITCSINFLPDDPKDYIGNCIAGQEGWTPISHYYASEVEEDGQVFWEVKTIWIRQTYDGSMSPGSEWTLENGRWVRTVAVCNERNETQSSFTQTGPAGGESIIESTQTWEPCIKEDTEFDNGIALKLIIERCVEKCGYPIKSNFFDINPDGTQPGNSAYLCAQEWLKCIIVYAKSDIARANVSGNATRAIMTCEKLFGIFRDQYNVYWDLVTDPVTNITHICIEHLSYFENVTGETIDLTNNQCLRGNNIYSHQSEILPSKETFAYMEGVSQAFSTTGIKYEANCELGETLETEIDCVNNDVEWLIENAELEGDGFVFISATDFDNKKVLLNQVVPNDGIAHINGHHAWSNLLKCYFNHGRPQSVGTVNGEPTQFESSWRLKKQDTFTILDFPCDERKNLTCETQFLTKLGLAKPESIKWCGKGCTLELSLLYENPPCIIDPCPDFQPVIIQTNNSEECQPNYTLTLQFDCDDEAAIIWDHSGETTDTIIVDEYGTYCAYVRCGDCIKYAYTVIVPDDNDCDLEIETTASDPILNPCPTWIIETEVTGCNPDDEIEYLWSGPDNFTATTQSITVDTVGTYFVTAKCGCCTIDDQIDVIPVDACEDVFVFIDAEDITDQLECESNCPVYKLTAAVGGCDDPIIQWTDGQIGECLYVYEPGQYSVIVKCGCDCTLIDTIEIEYCCLDAEIVECDTCDDDCGEDTTGDCDCEVDPEDLPCVIEGTIICQSPPCETENCNFEKVLTAVPYGMFLPPVSYVWSNGASTQSITITEAGSYSVEIFASNGCSFSVPALDIPDCPCGCDCDALVDIITCQPAPSETECCFEPILASTGECTVLSDRVTWTNGQTDADGLIINEYSGGVVCSQFYPVIFTRTLITEECGETIGIATCENPCELVQLDIDVSNAGTVNWGELMYDGSVVADYVIDWCYEDGTIAFTSGAGANFDSNTMYSHPPSGTVLAQAGPLQPKIKSWSGPVPVLCVELCIDPVEVEALNCDSVFDVSYIGPGGITASEFTFIIDSDTEGIQFEINADNQGDYVCVTQDGVTTEYGQPFRGNNYVTLLVDPNGSPEVTIAVKNDNPDIQTIWSLEFKKCCTETVDCTDITELPDPVFLEATQQGCIYFVRFYTGYSMSEPLCPAITTSLCDICMTGASATNNGRLSMRANASSSFQQLGSAPNMSCFNTDFTVQGGLDYSLNFANVADATSLFNILTDPYYAANPEHYVEFVYKEPDCISDGTTVVVRLLPNYLTVTQSGGIVSIKMVPTNPFDDIDCTCEGRLYDLYESQLNLLQEPSADWNALRVLTGRCIEGVVPTYTDWLRIRCADGSFVTIQRRYKIFLADPNDPTTWELWEVDNQVNQLNYIIGAADNPQPPNC